MEFLRTIVPGVRGLPDAKVEAMLYYFNQLKVPRNHTFIEQGQTLDGSIYFIDQGSCESYLRNDSGFMRRGIMLQGSLFGAVPQGATANFSVVSTSNSCEVLHVKPESKKHLPDSVMRALREVLDETIKRRSAQCLPLAPVGILASQPPNTNTHLVKKQILPPVRNTKVPRPLSGKIPAIIQTGRRVPGAPQAPISPPRACSLPHFPGLFRRVVTEVDHEAFVLDPGECIAMTAHKPKIRAQKIVRIQQSASLPAISMQVHQHSHAALVRTNPM